MAIRRRRLGVRALVLGLALAASAVGLEPAPVQAAHGPEAKLAVAKTGVSATATVRRSGWGGMIVLEVKDTANDGHCVIATVELNVADGPDPSRTDRVCGAGNRVSHSQILKAGSRGTSIPSVTLHACVEPVTSVTHDLK